METATSATNLVTSLVNAGTGMTTKINTAMMIVDREAVEEAVLVAADVEEVMGKGFDAATVDNMEAMVVNREVNSTGANNLPGMVDNLAATTLRHTSNKFKDRRRTKSKIEVNNSIKTADSN